MPKVVFSAFDFNHGTELWVTDGTAAGTYLLRDIYPGGASGLPTGAGTANNIVGLGNGKALFGATTGNGLHSDTIEDMGPSCG
jgi:ELWxxDGT repeat protein